MNPASLRSTDAIRKSAERWTSLKDLLRRLEQLAMSAALLDADRTGSDKLAEAAAFDEALADLQREFTRESTKLTVESLQATMRKRLRDAPAASPALALAQEEELRAKHGLPASRHSALRRERRSFTREELQAALERHGYNKLRASRELGVSWTALQYHLKRHQLA